MQHSSNAGCDIRATRVVTISCSHYLLFLYDIRLGVKSRKWALQETKHVNAIHVSDNQRHRVGKEFDLPHRTLIWLQSTCKPFESSNHVTGKNTEIFCVCNVRNCFTFRVRWYDLFCLICFSTISCLFETHNSATLESHAYPPVMFKLSRTKLCRRRFQPICYYIRELCLCTASDLIDGFAFWNRRNWHHRNSFSTKPQLNNPGAWNCQFSRFKSGMRPESFD